MVPNRYGRQAKKVVDPTAKDGGSAGNAGAFFGDMFEVSEISSLCRSFVLSEVLT